MPLLSIKDKSGLCGLRLLSSAGTTSSSGFVHTAPLRVAPAPSSSSSSSTAPNTSTSFNTSSAALFPLLPSSPIGCKCERLNLHTSHLEHQNQQLRREISQAKSNNGALKKVCVQREQLVAHLSTELNFALQRIQELEAMLELDCQRKYTHVLDMEETELTYEDIFSLMTPTEDTFGEESEYADMDVDMSMDADMSMDTDMDVDVSVNVDNMMDGYVSAVCGPEMDCMATVNLQEISPRQQNSWLSLESMPPFTPPQQEANSPAKETSMLKKLKPIAIAPNHGHIRSPLPIPRLAHSNSFSPGLMLLQPVQVPLGHSQPKMANGVKEKSRMSFQTKTITVLPADCR